MNVRWEETCFNWDTDTMKRTSEQTKDCNLKVGLFRNLFCLYFVEVILECRKCEKLVIFSLLVL
jgi:hypothetical protein